MTTDDRTQRTPGTGSGQAGGDPLRMSESEKRMAEWEARHDVAARGHRPAPDVLQHYLAHERLVHERPAAERRPPADPTADAGGDDDQDPPAAAPAAGKGTPGFLRRLFRRG
ncbi:MAG: hypothetical protein JHC71_18415 [Blastococcus sp.]|nr:hypothetical protein [Blastococcus sp.]